MWHHGCSGRRRPRPPARLGDLTSFGAAPRSPPVPSGPSGALHTSDAWCADGWLGALSCAPARPRHRPPAPRPGPAAVHRHHGLAPQAPRRPPIGRGSLSVCCPPWPSGPSCALHTGACGAVCGGASSRCPAGRTAAFHRSGIIVVSGLVLPPPINFACNSPPLSCRFVSVCSVVSLVFLNCMRLLLNAAPDSARRYRGGAFWTLSALPIDQTGCVCG